jgi:hypothetical protein
MLSWGSTVLLTALVCWLTLAHTLRHHLAIHNDDRKVFKIETFGFVAGGEMEIKVMDFTLHFKGKEMADFKNSSKLVPSLPSALSPVLLDPAVPAATVALVAAARVAPVTPVAPVPVVFAAVVYPVAAVAIATPDAAATGRRLQSPTDGQVAQLPTGSPHLVGFVMRHARSESAAQADLEGVIEKRQCILDKLQPHDVFLDLSDPDTWKNVLLKHEVAADNIGLYSLIFQRCYPAGLHHTSFKLDATFYNPGPNYLSAGDAPLPTMYLVFFLLFAVVLVAWGWLLYGRSPTTDIVHRVHHMMFWLLVLKVLSLFFESVRYHYIALFGVSQMWSEVYYVFAFLKGVMLFTVILLIGSGWSLMKSYLNGQEKRIVWVVLTLQVLDNIAMIVLEETAPGSQGWLTWRDILHLVDIICCCAILLPIVWSIRHLR